MKGRPRWSANPVAQRRRRSPSPPLSVLAAPNGERRQALRRVDPAAAHSQVVSGIVGSIVRDDDGAAKPGLKIPFRCRDVSALRSGAEAPGSVAAGRAEPPVSNVPWATSSSTARYCRMGLRQVRRRTAQIRLNCIRSATPAPRPGEGHRVQSRTQGLLVSRFES